MSGLSRTPGKRVGANNPPRVRIPLSPPRHQRHHVSRRLKTRIEPRVHAGFFVGPRLWFQSGPGPGRRCRSILCGHGCLDPMAMSRDAAWKERKQAPPLVLEPRALLQRNKAVIKPPGFVAQGAA